jgi:CubicO group peptidase (beta-lactamase class C family)
MRRFARVTMVCCALTLAMVPLLAQRRLPREVALQPVQPGAAKRPSISIAGTAALSSYLVAAVERGDVPGVQALIVSREGVLYEGVAGKRDVARGVEMRPDTLFRIASMTKPITSVAVMMLIEAGKLDLDDPVAKYLPAFKDRQVLSAFDATSGAYETRPAKRPITIRHLLSHTSGLGYSWSSEIVSRLTKNVREREPDVPLLDDPGERWTYSVSTRVLGLVIETVSGQPLEVFLRDKILAPLGMADTSFAVPAAKVARVTTVHSRVDGRLIEEPNAPIQEAPVRGDGGLYSTAHDYGNFLQMLLNDGRWHGATLLNARSVRAMGENQIGTVVIQEQPAADPKRTRPFPLGAGHDKFGLGFQIAVGDEGSAKHRSPGSLSWAGINNTHFWIDPDRQIAVVLLMQVLPFYDDACIRTLRGFEELVYQHLN